MKKAILYFTAFVGVLVILISLGSTIAIENYWWLKVLDFPRLQLLVISLILLPVFLWLTHRRTFLNVAYATGLIAAIGIQLYHIYPYTDLVDETVETVIPHSSNATFDLMVVNVFIHNRQTEKLYEIIDETDPDIILAMETDHWWENALQPLDERYPFGMEYPLNNGYGMILYSEYPLKNEEIKFLNYPGVPSFHASVLLPGGRVFGFHGLHPVPPLPGKRGSEGGKEKTLRKIGEIVQEHSLPAVVAGDLNDVAWARRERLFEQGGLLNDVRIGRAIINTYNAKSPFIRWPLDYVYVTGEFGVVELKRLPDFGSDHFPLYIKLVLMNGGQNTSLSPSSS